MATTTTTRTLPTPPPGSPFPRPSPSKKDSDLKPNPHPYAIKTTSTGILTRSNSSGYNINATHHYYIPTSPSPSRPDSGKGHRSTKSLNAVPESPTRDSPRPLPIPPALESPSFRRDGSGASGGYVSAEETASMPPRRPRRSETLPVIPLPSPALTAPAPSVDDLPENPKLWTPSQLAVYLTTALRMTSNGKPGEIEPIGLPALVAKDIASFVKSARIGGRTFLRLNEEDLAALGMNKKWRDALLTAARNLRQNVLKGRIWGADGSPTTSPSPQSASPPKLFSNPELNSSSSSIESSASISAGEDEDCSPGAALGRSKARRYRNGRVRGMIETFERSGSFSSDGGLEDGEGGPAEERASLRRWARETGHRSVGSPSASPSKRRPLPIPPSPSGSHSSRAVLDEEPTMESLLAELANSQPLTGAQAWEQMDLAAGVTVKRIPSGGESADISETMVGKRTIVGLGSGKSSGGSSKGKSDRRIVTAIFTPANAENADALKPLDSTGGLETFPDPPPLTASPDKAKSRPLPPTPDEPEAVPVAAQTVDPAYMSGTGASHDVESLHLERMLEEEILATRALLETFRARLEVVEQKVADLEAKEAFRDKAETSVEIGVQSVIAVADVEIQSAAMDERTAVALEAVSEAVVDIPPTVPEPGPTAKLPTSSSSTSTALQTVIPQVVRRLQDPTGLFSSPARKRKDEDEPQPASVGDLPSYVLLVGLGVCAVVIQVVLRKVVGKGSGFRP